MHKITTNATADDKAIAGISEPTVNIHTVLSKIKSNFPKHTK